MNCKKFCNEANQGCGWEAVSQNVCSHLHLPSAQLSGRASYAQVYTEDAGQFYTCAGI